MATQFREFKKKHHESSKSEARHIPLGIKIRILFVHPVFYIGLIFFVIGVLFSTVFLSMINFEDYKFSKELSITEGIVNEYSKTNAQENEEYVYKYNFSFSIDGQTYLSECYTTGLKFENNEIVKVEYLKNKPNIARISGSRKSVFFPGFILFVLIFPILGVILITVRLIFGFKSLYIVTYGQIAYGILVNKEPTNTQINNNTVFKMYFKFIAKDGKEYTTVNKTHLTYNLEDEVEEKLVYLPGNPEKAVLIDLFPFAVKSFFNQITN